MEIEIKIFAKNYYKLFCILNVLLFLTISNLFSAGKTIEVCHNCNKDQISTALEDSYPGDTILIHEGIYNEIKLFVTKPLYIVGEKGAIIDARNKGEIFVINSDSVIIENLILKNIPINYIDDLAAIRILKSDYCVIRNNKIYNSFFGIYLNKAGHCVVENNYIRGNAKSEISSGNAIHLWYCNHASIKNNQVSGHRDGIYIEFAKNSEISGNISQNNLRYGLHFMFSDDNLYHGNTFKNNGAGVAVMYSRRVVMTDNTFRDNQGMSSYGLLLKEIYDSEIRRNKFIKNTIGIYGEGAIRINIVNNEIRENGWALKILGSSTDNKFINNNFINNSFDLTTNTSRNYNVFKRNFWSKYTGYDLDKDGEGDVPYRPVSLFSYVISSTPESLILLRSFFVDIINFAEKTLPVFTPTDLKDNKPLMNRVKW